MLDCAKCKEKISRTAECVLCTACCYTFHLGCLEKELEGIVPTPAQKWRCDSCCKIGRKSIHGSPAADDLIQEAEEKVASFDGNFSKFRGEILNSLSGMEKFVEDIDHTVKQLKKEFVGIKEENRVLKIRVDALEVKDTKDLGYWEDPQALEIHGVLEAEVNDRYYCAKKLLKKMIGIEIDEKEIDECFFIKWNTMRGNSNSDNRHSDNANKPASDGILVTRFTTRRLREKVLKLWREKSANLDKRVRAASGEDRHFIKRRLGKATRELFRSAREMAKKHSWRFVWIVGGEIRMRRREGEKYRVIHSLQDLNNL